VTIIDVREPEELVTDGEIPRTINIPVAFLSVEKTRHSLFLPFYVALLQFNLHCISCSRTGGKLEKRYIKIMEIGLSQFNG
jgi:rhodanese-related sulfurtransferase